MFMKIVIQPVLPRQKNTTIQKEPIINAICVRYRWGMTAPHLLPVSDVQVWIHLEKNWIVLRVNSFIIFKKHLFKNKTTFESFCDTNQTIS